MRTILDEMFGGEPLPFRNVYEAAQVVVKDYMTEKNVKIRAVAEALGTTEGYLYAMLDPKADHKPLSADRVIEITALTGDRRIIEAMSLACEKSADSNGDGLFDLPNMTMEMQVGTGEFSQAVIDSLSDGTIDDREKRVLRRKALKQMKSIQRILEITD